MINIKGLSKAEVLKALWESSRTQGLSFLDVILEMTIEKAEVEIINKTNEKGIIYVDYCCGKVIKCNLTEDTFDERLFDRDNGEGAAYKAISKLLEEKGIHYNKMYSEGNIIDLIKIGYLDVTDERPVYRIIFEEGKGFAAVGIKPDERKIDLGEFFTKMYTEANISNDIKIKSSSPNYFDIEIPGFAESGAFCIYNDLLEEIKRAEQ